MPLSSGTRLGPYQIVAPLGAGGMGEVYRATDSNLKRSVAIKVLPVSVAGDADRLARFQREAEVLAALNHPNIAAIYGLERTPEGTALVMELVEGEDLSTLISRGPIQPSDALAIAKQIADALEAAHDQGIIHRDLKPANIKVRADGTVKVLDFGLAKAIDTNVTGATVGAMNSPTFTARGTQVGMIIGTAAYMAPEQARGKAVDRRADVWAFGVVLYEMLTGRRLFPGDEASDVLAAVLTKEPDWRALPGLSPTRVAYLRRALAKDPKQRLSDMATMRLALEGAFDIGTAPAPAAPSLLVWALGVVAVVSCGVAAFALWNRPVAVPQASTRLSIALPPGAEITSYPAISRDGRTVAYAVQRGSESPQLHVRDLDSFDARVVAGSTGAREPFFSPDGKWVAFFADGQLQKAEVSGGTPVRIAAAAYPFGGTWMPDDTIIYSPSLGSGLLQVPASGGTPKQISKPDGAANGYAHVFPQALPGGQTVLFNIWGLERGAATLSLASGRWTMALPSSTLASATYDPSRGAAGRLLIVDAAAGIRAAPFDPSHPARTTADALVLDDVYSQVETEALGWLAVSETGTAVYAAGDPSKTSLVWLGRDGAITPLDSPQDVYREVRISPDGTQAVVRQGLNLWVHDLSRGTTSPLTSGNDSIMPVWSPDGRRIVFASNRGGDWDIYAQAADGSRPAEVLLKRPGDQFPYSFASDGTLLYTEIAASSGRDLWTLAPDGKASPLRVTRFNEWAAEFSPEAGGPHWIAYSSDESGRPEIYVQTYPSGEHRVPVSTGGGVRPAWSPDGRELYFVTKDAVAVARMQPGGSFDAPRKLADPSTFLIYDRFQSYSVSPRGQRLLMIRRDDGSVPRQLNVIVNWSGSKR